MQVIATLLEKVHSVNLVGLQRELFKTFYSYFSICLELYLLQVFISNPTSKFLLIAIKLKLSGKLNLAAISGIPSLIDFVQKLLLCSLKVTLI